jgi:predicted RNA-binding protein with RPS1 domain
MLFMSTVDETSSAAETDIQATETPTTTADEITASSSTPEPPTEIISSDVVTAPSSSVAEPTETVSAEVDVTASDSVVEPTEMSSAEVDVPADVEAMDGINDEDEAHNSERPARKSLKKKPKGLPLTDFKVGDTIKATARSVAAYGAFMDVGAETDGLLHISNLSIDYVASVKDVIEVGQEYEVRILTIDLTKKQIALTLLTEEQEQQSVAAATRSPKRDQRSKGGDNSGGGTAGRRDEGLILKQLEEKGWDENLFVTGTVVSTVDFGAFVRVDSSQLNSEVAGEFDGLVHISALAAGRVKSVADAVKVGDVVQVRCKGIEQRKVSLSMVSLAAEAEAAEARGSSSEPFQDQGNKDWKEAMEKIQETMPTFSNKPVMMNSRKSS